ncbi:MAG TPA: hypothetical protein VKH45_03595 [Candidatus Acidoferrum sp.]|nr:hypothetical protein [Candidatus Acidoferrum sp.]
MGVILHGYIRVFLFYDVGEAFDQDKLRNLLGSRGGPTKPDFPRRTPDYVRFENPPIAEPSEPLTLSSGEKVVCSIKYYEYAIVEVQLEAPFSGSWDELLAQVSRWMDSPDLEPEARAVVSKHLQKIAPAVLKPREEWFHENYLVVELNEIQENAGAIVTADLLLACSGEQIAQLIRGEQTPLARSTGERMLQGSSLSYYPTDLLVVGSSAAFIYDRPEEAVRTIQILEYAKMQLLEFRYYDNFMTRVLSDVYNNVDRKQNVLLSRWTFPREANRLNTIRLDVMELTERIDNAVKFVSDTFYALAYRLAASRVGVPEYRGLVEEKLRTARELYDFMVAQFNETRLFLLEAAITVLCLLDVLLLLRGR